jgi:hypothetical protein
MVKNRIYQDNWNDQNREKVVFTIKGGGALGKNLKNHMSSKIGYFQFFSYEKWTTYK